MVRRVSRASSLKRRRTGTSSKSNSQSLDEEPSSTQSTIPVPTVSDGLGFLVIAWCSPESTPADLRCLRLLASFMETTFPFSSRTLNLPTVPKLLAPGLPTMTSLCFISQQTGLNLRDVIRVMRDAKTRHTVELIWCRLSCKSRVDQELRAQMDILSECWHLYIKKNKWNQLFQVQNGGISWAIIISQSFYRKKNFGEVYIYIYIYRYIYKNDPKCKLNSN